MLGMSVLCPLVLYAAQRDKCAGLVDQCSAIGSMFCDALRCSAGNVI